MKLIKEDKTNILLVSNYPETGAELEATLNQPDYYFVKVNSCIEGCRHLFEQTFALILLHIFGEVDKAVHLIKRLAQFYDIPVVFV